jgi:RNA polymerase sigma factor (sigma-70 family)
MNGSKAEQNSLVEHLCQRYQGMVVQIICRLGGDTEEDTAFILNDSLLVLLEKINDGTYQPDKSSLSTYFYAIAEKQMLNRLRKRKRRQQNWGDAPPLSLNLNDVEDKMNSKEAKEKVAAAILQLDESCQQVLKKYWLEDKSMKEIADEMGFSVDVAKQRNHRCMNRLRDLLKTDFEDWFNEK